MTDALALFILAMVAMWDGVLMGSDMPTISERFQALFPTWVDILIGLALAAIVAALPLHWAIKMVYSLLLGHVCWPNRERHK